MPACPSCTRSLTRSHRRLLERVIYAETYQCAKCGRRAARLYPGLAVLLTFVFSRYTHCIQCGSKRVQRTSMRHHVEAPSRHPVSRLLGLTGAPLNKCPRCRLQYCDWRTPRPISPEQPDVTHAATQ